MKSGTFILSLAVLSCIIAALHILSGTAFAGSGCGTNWMGDSSGDKDFYVSKNQNLGTSSGVDTAAAKPSGANLSTSATPSGQSAAVLSLTPDKAGPLAPGAYVVWTANASNSGDSQLLWDFLLKGPSTEGTFADKTGWTSASSWRWNITGADVGENQVEVRMRHADSSQVIASKQESYTVAPSSQGESTTSEVGSAPAEIETHPTSKTSSTIKSKPRLAPDERQSTQTKSTDISGANMNMPDPSPKTSSETSAEQSAQYAQQADEDEDLEPKIMQVDGKWTVRLENDHSSIDLILIQTGESVSGWGNLNEKNTKLPLIATGSASENSMSLDIKTVVGDYVNKIDKRFQLSLVKVDRIISGSYEAYSGEDLTGTGNATASRFAA